VRQRVAAGLIKIKTGIQAGYGMDQNENLRGAKIAGVCRPAFCHSSALFPYSGSKSKHGAQMIASESAGESNPSAVKSLWHRQSEIERS